MPKTKLNPGGTKTCKRGLHTYEGERCKPCRYASKKIHQAANIEAVRAKKRARYAMLTEEAKAKARATTRAWVKANYDYVIQQNRLYNQRNADKQRTRNRKAYWANVAISRSLVARKNHRRRARKADNLGDGCTPEEWSLILRSHKNRCADCGVSGNILKLCRDHIIPVAQGGPDMPHNLQPLCRPCNSRKRDHIETGTQICLFTKRVAT